MCHINHTTRIDGSNSCAGFTLVELVLATLISSLVIAIVSVSLGFSLRVWERNQNRRPDDFPSLVELLKWQLASFDPVQVREEGEVQIIFRGDYNFIAFATDRSVRAISNGVPVVARYVYQDSEKVLYYAEIPLDPYHPEVIKEFLAAKPSDSSSWPRFYPIPVDGFSLSYGQGDEKGGADDTWDDAHAIPAYVRVTWSRDGGATESTQIIIPNFLFAREIEEQQAGAQPGGK
jgi:prepilin-type N-terminal cleavage/methylation domain-containing protein